MAKSEDELGYNIFFKSVSHFECYNESKVDNSFLRIRKVLEKGTIYHSYDFDKIDSDVFEDDRTQSRETFVAANSRFVDENYNVHSEKYFSSLGHIKVCGTKMYRMCYSVVHFLDGSTITLYFDTHENMLKYVKESLGEINSIKGNPNIIDLNHDKQSHWHIDTECNVTLI